jgi:integrase
MAKAKKLPSGSWRVRVFSHKDADGKMIYRSFTSDDPSLAGRRKVEREAAEWAVKKEQQKYIDRTFRQCAEEYIANRESVLSPRTIGSYRDYMASYMGEIADKPIESITQTDIQRMVNIFASRMSPKTVRNLHGFISTVFRTYRPDFALHTKLPMKKASNIHIPSETEIKRLLAASKDTGMELPILLAVFGPMRRGEIAALRSENIRGNIVHVCENMVFEKEDGHKDWIIKGPKSSAGDRYIEYPDFVAKKWKGIQGRIVPMSPDNITSHFHRLLKRNNIPNFRFHDLRHYSASFLHAMGMPDAYIMQRGGWQSDGTLKRVYRHVLEKEAKLKNAEANKKFADLYKSANQ